MIAFLLASKQSSLLVQLKTGKISCPMLPILKNCVEKYYGIMLTFCIDFPLFQSFSAWGSQFLREFYLMKERIVRFKVICFRRVYYVATNFDWEFNWEKAPWYIYCISTGMFTLEWLIILSLSRDKNRFINLLKCYWFLDESLTNTNLNIS